jgi:PAS domain S-box-containing protein
MEPIKKSTGARNTTPLHSEDYYSSIFQGLGVDAAVIGADYRIQEINENALLRLGLSRDAVIGRKCFRILHGLEQPCHAHGVPCGLRQILEQGRAEPAVHQHLSAREGKEALQVMMSPLRDEAGEIRQVIFAAVDIRRAAGAGAEAAQMEDRLRHLVESANDIIYMHDPEGNFTAVNPAASRIYGYSREEMLGFNIGDLVDPGYLPLVKRSMQQRPDGDIQIEPYEVLTYNRSGAPVWLEINSHHMVRENENIGVIAIARDITDRKRLESQLRQAQKMEAIGTLAGGIAHDFNNILMPILLHSEKAMLDLPQESAIREDVQYIYESAERARELVRQILTFAYRGEENRIPLNASVSVRETVKLLRSAVPATIDIQYEAAAEKTTVLADPAQLTQIVMNLCTNATHAMREKGGVLRIRLTNADFGSNAAPGFMNLPPGTYVKLSVSDNGPGIPADIIDKIFEPYFTTKGSTEGTGLGLAVIHGIVRNYGGDISVESEPGEGTAFHVLLPAIGDSEVRKPELKAEVEGGAERILFVDDEKPVVDTIAPMLKRLGYRVTARTSSIEALEAFRHSPEAFDIVITDQTMPNMTGKELSKALISIRPDIRIIICTGFSEQIDERRAEKLGIRGFIMKPVVVREIAKKIRAVLDAPGP